MITIECFGRINLGIIDLSDNPYRIDGTHGLYTNLKIATVKLKRWSELSINIESEFEKPLFQVVERCLKYLEKSNKFEDVFVEIHSLFKRHIGLGSGTQISMSIVEAFNLEFSIELTLNEKALLAGSGGTSGVGVYCFENGGYVLDSGRLFPQEKCSIGPSEAFCFEKLPPLISRLELPNWNICFLIPKTKSFIEGEKEQDLFNAFTPINQNETGEICKWILKGIMPAILEKNFKSFCYSIEQIMKIGFRAKEIHYYGDFLSDRINALKQTGLNGVGMTSFGPTLFGFFDDYSTQTFILNYLNTLFPTDTVIFTTTRNVGANINAY